MNEKKIAVLGLGYVGLPLALELSFHYKVIGFDINSTRIRQLKKGIDLTLEVEQSTLKRQQGNQLNFTNKVLDLRECNFFIATVPTPIDKKKRPDFSSLINVCKILGPILKKEDVVVFESTVYPGATEEICGPTLEKSSKKLTVGKDFFLGYSPERVNPGDKVHTIDKINKVISGQNSRVENDLKEIYSKLTKGKIFLAKSIKVAEAAKVIENAQRDINIAFINEVAKICTKINISTYDVLDASLTKWNFLKFEPGLVGGHCIGVDPYYLADQAINKGYNPEIILAGRKVNDNMGEFIANEVIYMLKLKKQLSHKSKVLIMGVTFKENCPDYRNTKVIDIYKKLEKLQLDVDIFDPWVDKKSFYDEYNLKVNNDLPNKKYNAVIIAVSHKEFTSIDIKSLRSNEASVIYDVKGMFNKQITTSRL